MLAPSRNGRPLRNINRNKRLFEGVEGGLKDGEPLRYMNRGSTVLEGVAVINPAGQSGILCACCHKIVSCSQFETHAGHSQRRQPYECIFTSDGRNLKTIAAALPVPEGAGGDADADDADAGAAGSGGCVLCHDPEFQRGEFGPRTMMLCDQCEREFHVGCMAAGGVAALEGLPEGDWFCSAACGRTHGLMRSFVKAGLMQVVFDDQGRPVAALPGEEPAGTVAGDGGGAAAAAAGGKDGGGGVDAGDAEGEDGGAAAAALSPPPSVGPPPDAVAAAAKAVASQVAAALAQATVADAEEAEGGGGAEAAAAGGSAEESPADADQATDGDAGAAPGSVSVPLPPPEEAEADAAELCAAGYSWQVLNGKDGTMYTTYSVKAAAEILQESFDPIIDLSTNTDLLPLMLYAKQYGDWDYRGVYTLLLRHRGKPVVAATCKVFGPQCAELPLIATKTDARRQGHARVLVSLFMSLLSQAGVHRLVLPAAHETVQTWKAGFGFADMAEEEVAMAKQQLRILVFPGTEVLWKEVEGTVAPTGHHVLRPLPDPDDVTEVRRAVQRCVTAAAVEAGEEEPPPPTPEPEPEAAPEAGQAEEGGTAGAAPPPPAGDAQAGVEHSYAAMIEQAMAEGAAAADAGPAEPAEGAAAVEPAPNAPGPAADVDMPDA